MTLELFRTQESSNLFTIDKAISKKMIDATGIKNETIRFVLDRYGKAVSNRLLNNEGYSVSHERSKNKYRKVLFFRLKRADNADVTLGPELKIDVDTQKGHYKIPIITELSEFAKRISKISTEKRYEFPKI